MRAGLLHLAFAALAIAERVQVVTLSTPAPVSIAMVAATGAVVGAVCDDQKLRLWTFPEGHPSREIGLGKRTVDAAVLSPDGRKIAAGDHTGLYTVWDVTTGAEQFQVRLPSYPFALAFSPDSRRLAIAPAGQRVQIYDLETRARSVELHEVTGGAFALAFTTDGGKIATADADTAVRIYDSRNGEILARNDDFLLIPLAAAFTPDGKRLLTGGADKRIVVLDALTGNAVARPGKLADPVAYLAISPDGMTTAAALLHADNLLSPAPVIVTETESGRKLQEWVPPHRVLGGGWTNAGHLLMATGGDKGLHIWRLR